MLLGKTPELDLQIIINNYCNILLDRIPLIRLLDRNQHDWEEARRQRFFCFDIHELFSYSARYPAGYLESDRAGYSAGYPDSISGYPV